MKLSYETLLSPTPIKLSVGTIRKPTLREISELTFNEFDAFKFFLKLTPKRYYKTILNAEDKWDSMSDDEKSNITLYKCIMDSERLQETYSLILNFFFIEDVIYDDGIFIISKDANDKSKVCGALFAERFDIILLYLQQVCMIYEEPDEEKPPVFKNDLARKIYEKIKISNDKSENIHISNHWRIRKTLYCATTGGRKYVRLICEMIYTKKVRRRCFGTRVA